MIDRYTRDEMGEIWTLENKFRQWLKVEVLACQGWAELGVIPEEDAEVIAEKADFDVERVKEIEKETRHDVVAFTTNMAEYVGQPEARHIHYGLTSSDVVDTANSVLIKQAGEILLADLERLAEVLAEAAKEYKHRPVIGRTHGIHAEPTSLGLKFALWYSEIERQKERLRETLERTCYGKISGAVGTYAHVEPFLEEFVCERLGLRPAPISTQIIQRDRHAEFVSALALIGASLEKFATEIRNLQRTEMREVEEPFRSGQKGSSSMPHKRNPIVSERICGQARVLRANAQVALENVALWHERDISHSSTERIVLPDSTILLDYMLNKFIQVIEGLHVYPENMDQVLNTTEGLIFSQSVLLKLVEKGLSREKAYGVVQEKAMQAWQDGLDFRQLIEDAPLVDETLTRQELEECFDYDYHLRHVDLIYDRLGLN